MKITTLVQLYDCLTDNEKIIVDVLRGIVTDTLPSYCKEKISFSVPYFYGNKGICIIWPASIPRGGIKTGVFFGLWYGNLLPDKNNYLTHGTNKQIFYKIYNDADEIDTDEIQSILLEAIEADKRFGNK